MRLLGTLGALALALAAGPAFAANFEVLMLNKGEAGAMVFEPALVQLEPGDTVTFVATDKGHNAETIKDLIPEGATPFKGKINEEIVVTFDPQFIADFLKVLDPASQVTLKLINANSAAVFTADENYTYVVMPLARDGR